MTQDKAKKTATRQRMAETGEPYSVARRAVEDEAAGAQSAADAGSLEKLADPIWQRPSTAALMRFGAAVAWSRHHQMLGLAH